LHKAILLKENNRPEEALALFDLALEDYSESDPKRIEPMLEKGLALRLLRRHEEAQNEFERILRNLTDHERFFPVASFYFGVGEALFGRDAAALEYFERALRTTDENSGLAFRVILEKVRLFLRQGRYAESLELLKTMDERAVRRTDQAVSAALLHGDVFRAMGRDDEAEKAYAEALKRATENRGNLSAPLLRLAELRLSAGQLAEAELSAAEARERDAHAEGSLFTARLQWAKGRADEALTICDELLKQPQPAAFEMQRKTAAALLLKAEILYAQGRNGETINICGRIVSEFPDMRDIAAEALALMGTALRRSEKFSDAERTFGDVEKKFPEQKSACLKAALEMGALKSLGPDGAAADVSSIMMRIAEQFDEPSEIARTALALVLENKKVPPFPEIWASGRRNDLIFIMALFRFGRENLETAKNELRTCLEHTLDLAKVEWPALTAKELLNAWEKKPSVQTN
jgi:tetratricopeptide (TPR) repeat protein